MYIRMKGMWVGNQWNARVSNATICIDSDILVMFSNDNIKVIEIFPATESS